jgi:hypothetical protein
MPILPGFSRLNSKNKVAHMKSTYFIILEQGAMARKTNEKAIASCREQQL